VGVLRQAPMFEARDCDAAAVFGELGKRLFAQADGVTGQLQIEPADEPPSPPAGAPISFDKPLDLDDPALHGRSIEELIVGSPLFPPIEGLDRSIWEKKNCGTCHQWTRERLCTQAKTYVGAEKMVRRIEHPYGIAFKQALERWAEGGCL
jgi:hypothetical protein